MLALAVAPSPEVVNASDLAKLRELNSGDNQAVTWIESGVTFVGVQYDHGRLVLGYGEDFEEALKAAQIKNNG